MATTNAVKLISGAPETWHDDELNVEMQIFRGALDPTTLQYIQIGDYQREKSSPRKINGLIKPIIKRQVPDIYLGSRGGRMVNKNGVFVIPDDVFCIDGQQRLTAALLILARQPEVQVSLGCRILFNTTETDERRLFDALNTTAQDLSPAIILRNRGKDYEALQRLIDLTHGLADKAFPLDGKICWSQSQPTGMLVNGRIFIRVSNFLHNRLGGSRSSNLQSMVDGVVKVGAQITISQMVMNMSTFYKVFDDAWGLKNLKRREQQPHLYETFQLVIARLFNQFPDQFWEPARTNDTFKSRLAVAKEWRDRLGKWDIFDRNIAKLAGSGTSAGDLLYGMLIQHLNRRRAKNNQLIDLTMTQLNPEDAPLG